MTENEDNQILNPIIDQVRQSLINLAESAHDRTALEKEDHGEVLARFRNKIEKRKK